MKWLERVTMLPFPFWALCTDEADFKRELKKRKLHDATFISPGANATVHRFENSKKQTILIVCLRKERRIPRAEVYSWLVHEAVHIWQEIRLDIGETNPSSEFEAYVMQFLTHKLIEAYEDAL